MVSVDMKTNENKRPKRTRSAEIHNLSERVIFQINFDLKFPWKGYLIPHPSLTSYDQLDYICFEQRRRDRIKGKMRALQELVPNCNKVTTHNCFSLLHDV